MTVFRLENKHTNFSINRTRWMTVKGAIVRMQHVDRQHCLEIKWRTGDLTFCEWQTHYWHVQGHCSQARDNGAVPVYWPSRQRAAHWWTTPSVFWQQVDNCLRCDGMCIFPIYGPVRHIQLLDTYQRDRQVVVHVVNLQTLLIHTGKDVTNLDQGCAISINIISILWC